MERDIRRVFSLDRVHLPLLIKSIVHSFLVLISNDSLMKHYLKGSRGTWKSCACTSPVEAILRKKADIPEPPGLVRDVVPVSVFVQYPVLCKNGVAPKSDQQNPVLQNRHLLLCRLRAFTPVSTFLGASENIFGFRNLIWSKKVSLPHR